MGIFDFEKYRDLIAYQIEEAGLEIRGVTRATWRRLRNASHRIFLRPFTDRST